MGLPASAPGSSRLVGSTFEDKGDRGLMEPVSPTGGGNKAFSFISGKSALIAPILEGLWFHDKVYAKSLKTTRRLTALRMFLGLKPMNVLMYRKICSRWTTAPPFPTKYRIFQRLCKLFEY